MNKDDIEFLIKLCNEHIGHWSLSSAQGVRALTMKHKLMALVGKKSEVDNSENLRHEGNE